MSIEDILDNVGLSLENPDFADIDKLTVQAVENIVNDRDDVNDERAAELTSKIAKFLKKDRDGDLNNRDRRILKKMEKQQEELQSTGRVVAWIEEDILLAIEEKLDQEDAEDEARKLKEKAAKKAAPAPAPVKAAPVYQEPAYTAPVKAQEEAEDDDSNSYVKVNKEDVDDYVASDKDEDDDVEDDSDKDSSDEDEDDYFADYYDDFESKKKQDKAKKARKMKEKEQEKKHEAATAHIKEGDRYFENILKKVEILKGKGKPIYTLAAKKLYTKGKGKAAEMKGSSGSAASYPSSPKGQGKGSVADIGKGLGPLDAEEDSSDDESDEEEVVNANARYDEWGDLIEDPNASPKKTIKKPKKEKKDKKSKAAAVNPFPNSSPGFVAPEYDIPQDAQILACPVCTFHNHIQNENCEICGASLEPPAKDEPTGPSRYIRDQQAAFKEQVKISKGKGKQDKIETVDRTVVVDGAGRIKVVTKTEEDLKKEKQAMKKKQIAEEKNYADDDEEGSEDEDDFFNRARTLNETKKLNVGTDFTAQFVGNGKLNPSAEAAIKEKNEREKRLEDERRLKEEKAAKKEQKRREKEWAEKKEQEAEMARIAEEAAKKSKDAEKSKAKKEKLKPAVKGQEGSNW